MKWKTENVFMALSGIAFSIAAISAWIYLNTPANQGPQQDMSALILEHKSDLFKTPTDPVLGNPDGDVTLVEFSDYRCTYCKFVHPTVMKLLEKDGGIRLVAKEYPVLGPVSTLAARAVLASQKQGGYGAFSTALMAARGLNEDSLFQIAKNVGLNPQRLRADMKTFADEINATIAANLALGKALKLPGTPIFIAGQTMVPGATSLAGLEKLIAAARAFNIAQKTAPP